MVEVVEVGEVVEASEASEGHAFLLACLGRLDLLDDQAGLPYESERCVIRVTARGRGT